MDRFTDTDAAAHRLATERKATVEQINALVRAHGEIIEAATSVATDDEHDPEGPTIAFERAQAAAMLQRAQTRLRDLDRAIVRLSQGGYGICELCGLPIAPDRLDALPATRTCIACAGRAR